MSVYFRHIFGFLRTGFYNRLRLQNFKNKVGGCPPSSLKEQGTQQIFKIAVHSSARGTSFQKKLLLPRSPNCSIRILR